MAIRLLLADDHQMLVEALQALLRDHPDLATVGSAGDGESAVTQTLALRPDVLLLDIDLPGCDGLAVLDQLRQAGCPTRVLVLSAHAERRIVREALHAGAWGYLCKTGAWQQLATAIRTIAAGGTFVGPDLLAAESDPAAALSEREREVLMLVADGLTSAAIGHRLGITPKTVDAHRQRIMAKLELHSTADLVKYALREGLTRLDP